MQAVLHKSDVGTRVASRDRQPPAGQLQLTGMVESDGRHDGAASETEHLDRAHREEARLSAEAVWSSVRSSRARMRRSLSRTRSAPASQPNGAAIQARLFDILAEPAPWPRIPADPYAELEAARTDLQTLHHVIAHDLTSPLRCIEGLSTALIEDYGSALDQTALDYLDRIVRAATREACLIDDVMALYALARCEMRMEDVDLSGIALAEAARAAERYPHHVEFVCQAGLRHSGDRNLIQELISSLIDNAWKFTGAAGSAQVQFGAAEACGEHSFFIRDNGIGFDCAQAGRLFRPFHRLHAERDYPGRGIGLASVQRIVQRHGGRIVATSERGAGTAFYFTLGW